MVLPRSVMDVTFRGSRSGWTSSSAPEIVAGMDAVGIARQDGRRIVIAGGLGGERGFVLLRHRG